jgi:two-component system, cell cycle sensor histidine kinase and response regulator CckA
MRPNTATHFGRREQQAIGNDTSRHRSNGSKQESSRQATATKTENHHQLVARATNDAVRDWNLATDVVIWRQGLDTLLGWHIDASSSTNAFWQRRLHPDDRTRVTASIREAIRSSAEHWTLEYRFRHADGSYLTVLERAQIVRDKEGTAERFVGVLMDVTQRKQLQDQLLRSQKMEAFGHLAGGVAHDYNNLLTAILGYSDIILGEIDGRSTIAKYINEIRNAATRASSLTQQLLAFTQPQAPQSRILQLNALLIDAERSILPLLGEHISVMCELLPEKNAAHVKIDPNEFGQVIVNLAVNARDAMAQGGTLVLKAETAAIIAAESYPMPTDLPPGDYAIVSLIDNGNGMTEEVKKRLFEPFFTTKDERHVSGLGLATCDALLRKNGGRIVVESEKGKGTAVHIYLPIIPNASPGSYKKPRLSSMPTGNETVLVVEDDLSVRHVTARTLRLLGYNVIEAMRADEAKRCITQRPEAIDLVVSDIVLPDISGRDFAKWTRAHSPRTQIVLISGYLPDVTASGENSHPFCLPKPFDPEQLATTVRGALDAAVVN